jgi:hypothetical protein
MAEYFWIQKNDAEGRTIALENRIKVSAESVASKLHEIASLKESSLAKNQLFALSKLLGKANRVYILLKGSILEKDDAGRNIPFSLLKEFSPNDDYKKYIRNLPNEMNDVFKSAGIVEKTFNIQDLENVCIIAQQSDSEYSTISVEKIISMIKKNPRAWITAVAILIFILIVLFK